MTAEEKRSVKQEMAEEMEQLDRIYEWFKSSSTAFVCNLSDVDHAS